MYTMLMNYKKIDAPQTENYQYCCRSVLLIYIQFIIKFSDYYFEIDIS